MIKHGWNHDFDVFFDDLKNFFIIWELFRFSDSQRRFSTFSGIFLNISDFTGGFLAGGWDIQNGNAAGGDYMGIAIP